MALALVLISTRADDLLATNEMSVTDPQEGSVMVARDSSPEEAALADAIIDASTGDGQLERLIIDDVRIGTGEAVEIGDTVHAHYIGATQEGVQFDSSYERGGPFVFTVGESRVIEGWEKGIIGMKPGGQRILIIPPEMAYGNRQVGVIEPNSVLVFAIELLEIR